MAKSKGRAGRNIRLLALTRRFKAIYSFIGAGIILYLPFPFATFSEAIRQPLTNSNPEIANSPALPPIIYVAAVVFSMYLVANGIFLWKRANHADQGAKGEEDIAREISSLADSGWQVEYGKRLGKGIGDIDIVYMSPNGKAYVIDVKSHKGTVTTDGKKLYRRIGKTQYPFEKDFLAQVTRQALQVKKKTGVDFVTPIVAFSNARVAIAPALTSQFASNKVKHVYVIDKARLAGLLRSLG
ncbi:NERD domain-containing protein [Leptolyngbya cf. ectocarpi LEGE 11479]|uniref:NERD domain-containing protein n=1 Tax=Leptolyngbya cf. ectocarpi LEGE 11479 TaxID=1828722 RepID=A0A928X1D6_LEPEC|nr:nuclease-related domain-containing protein [Leptolyngbya ectocarpi]MBE9065764.1 NERD domain-containing protein [Leptolyngbya cf. ectocarpi LEGE 11479]